MKKHSTLAAALLASLGGLGIGAFGPLPTAQTTGQVFDVAKDREATPKPVKQTPTPSRVDQVLRAFGVGRITKSGPRPWPSLDGWSNRRYQRAALKRRNRARHRAACNGGR